MEYVRSPEVEHFAASLAHAYLIERSGKRAAALIEAIENEFYYSVARFFGTEPPTAVIRVLFAALNDAVLSESARISTNVELSPALHAQLMQTAASLAAASARNTVLLTGLDKLDKIYRFQQELATQTAALHSSMRLPHAGTSRQVPYEELFVAPDIWLTPGRDGPNSASATLAEILQLAARVVILGDPGGGKSTQAHKLTYDIASGTIPFLRDRVPFLVVLRDYAPMVRGEDRQSLAEYIEGLCRSPYHIEPPESAIEYLLLNDRAVVILDGLDELLDTSLRRDVVQAVEGFANRYPTCPIVVTSRRVGYDEAPLGEHLFERLELGKFSPRQVGDYAAKWFALDESIAPLHRKRLAKSFIADSAYVADLRANPLLLSLMCGIYASEGYIPANRPDVYEKCALLLFDRWDKQRGILAPLPFDAHVQSAMRSLALYMFTEHPSDEGIPRDQLVAYMRNYLRSKRFDSDESAEDAAIEFIEFCKGRAWVLTDVGAELYGFTHRTFMEYFAANQLVRLDPNARQLFDRLEPYLREEAWDVVAQLALQILGKVVEDGADDFLSYVVDAALGGRESPDLNLLSFACRALEFIVPRPSVLTAIVDAAVGVVLSSYAHRRNIKREEEIYRTLLQGASAENRPRICAAARVVLEAELVRNPLNEAALLLATVSPVRKKENLAPAASTDLFDWAIENRNLLSTAAGLQRSRRAWVAVIDFESGRLDITDMLRNFGPSVLYDYKMCGLTGGPPIAYRFHMNAERSCDVTLEPFVDQFPSPDATLIARAVLRYLPRLSDPWLKYRGDYIAVAEVVMFGPVFRDSGESGKHLSLEGAKEVQSAAVLLSLPLIEISIARDSVRKHESSEPTVSMLLARDRRAGMMSDELGERIGSIFGHRLEAAALVSDWVAGSRTVTSNLPVKRASKNRSVSQ
jgi:hypothetical protein